MSTGFSKWLWATRNVVACVLVIALVLAASGCSSEGSQDTRDTATATSRRTDTPADSGRPEGSNPTPSSTGSTSVTASGFTVTDGTTELTALAGVAPVGTTVTMMPSPQPDLPAAIEWVAASPGFDVKLGNGLQPASPVTVTTTVDPAQ